MRVVRAARVELAVQVGLVAPAGQAALTGTATDALGRPVPNQRVSLAIGDARYSVHTDSSGNFQFPVASLPPGTGTIMAGTSKVPITYAGMPLRNVKLIVPTSQAVPPVSAPRFPGDIRLRSVEPEEQQRPSTGPTEELKPAQ